MYKGEPIKGIDFFNLLMESPDFTSEMGKVTLAASRLEAELMNFLKRKGVKENLSKKTLGQLIRLAKKKGFLDKNLIDVLNLTLVQRNYLTHNIYALHIDLLEQTILEKEDLIDTDVLTYIDRAWETKNRLIDMYELIRKR